MYVCVLVMVGAFIYSNMLTLFSVEFIDQR